MTIAAVWVPCFSDQQISRCRREKNLIQVNERSGIADATRTTFSTGGWSCSPSLYTTKLGPPTLPES
jgi:hypothetical protein